MTADDLIEMEQIKRVKYRYLRAMDTADHALLATLFTPDVSARFVGGSYDVSVEGRAQLLEYLAVSANADVVVNHNCHHPEIDLTAADAAEGLWYLQDWYYNRRDRRIVRGASFYRDRYQKIAGAWLIRHTGYERVFEIVENDVPPINFTANVLGSRGRRTG
ncbi:MAG TPA: nuclear transport factor 2 family protein [Steroidobacteraceae bacterium]|nr:nuclear transport factor 2 family protein [Steroidobacteraceae bacterium]